MAFTLIQTVTQAQLYGNQKYTFSKTYTCKFISTIMNSYIKDLFKITYNTAKHSSVALTKQAYHLGSESLIQLNKRCSPISSFYHCGNSLRNIDQI